MPSSNQVLIERVIADNCHDSFSILVERHQSDLRYSLRQMTGWDESLADDIAQETFLKAFNAIRTYKADAKFSSWLYRIAYNQMINHFRLARNRELTGLEEALSSNMERPVGGEFLKNQLHQDIAKAMQALPPQQRMVIHLHLHRQLTHNEICKTMEIPLGTVKTLITRGKARLRDLLSNWEDEDVK